MKILTLKIRDEDLAEVLSGISKYVVDLTVSSDAATPPKTRAMRTVHREKQTSAELVLDMLDKQGPQRQSKLSSMLSDRGYASNTASATLSGLRQQGKVSRDNSKKTEDAIWTIMKSEAVK